MDKLLATKNIRRLEHFCCYQLDPTKDSRWADLVARHPKASIFHTVAWIEALRRTYGYEPVVFTTSPPSGNLQNGLVLCRIKSWLTGRRLVSLPFSDHCEPLYDSAEELDFVTLYLQSSLSQNQSTYIELRPVSSMIGQSQSAGGFSSDGRYFLHILDLRPGLDEIFHALDKDSIQRRVHRAERAELVEKTGRSKDELKTFYELFVVTRRRHGLPPIPEDWFKNLITFQGEALEIRCAYWGAIPIAAILTLRFRNTVYYKYGCSNARFHKFGAMPWLLWRAISEAKSSGATQFDLGRTAVENEGLSRFKNHWVARPQQIVYWRFPGRSRPSSISGRKLHIAKCVCSRTPNRVLKSIGNVIYRHIG